MKSSYKQFHNSLPKSSLHLHWILVWDYGDYELGVTTDVTGKNGLLTEIYLGIQYTHPNSETVQNTCYFMNAYYINKLGTRG